MKPFRFGLFWLLLFLPGLVLPSWELVSAQRDLAPNAAPVSQIDLGLGFDFFYSKIYVNPVTKQVLVFGPNRILAVIDTVTNRVVRQQRVTFNLQTCAISPTANQIYVVDSFNRLFILDGTTLEAREPLPLPPSIDFFGLAFNGSGTQLYALTSEHLLVIDPQNGIQTATIKMPQPGFLNQALAVNSLNNRIYVYRSTGQLLVIDANNQSILSQISVPSPDSRASIGVNPLTNRIYLGGARELVVVNGETNAVVKSVPVGIFPADVAVNSETNRIYVLNGKGTGFFDNTVSVVEGTNDTVVGTLTGKRAFFGLALVPGTNRILLMSGENSYLLAFDGATNSLVEKIVLRADPTDIAVNEKTNRVYVANRLADTVTVIDSLTNTVLNQINVDPQPSGIVVNPVTNRVFVNHERENLVSIIDGATNQVVKTIPLGRPATSLIVNPVTNRLFVALYDDPAVTAFDGNSGQLLKTQKLTVAANEITVNPQTNLVYLASQQSSAVQIVDGETLEIHPSIELPQGTFYYGMALNPETNRLYVSDNRDKFVVVMDLNTKNVLARIPLEGPPSRIAINRTTNRVFVASSFFNSISILDGATNQLLEVFRPDEFPRFRTPLGIGTHAGINRTYVSFAVGDTVAVLAGEDPPTATLQFFPATIKVNERTQLTITLTNPNSTPLSGISFRNSLPDGVLVQAGESAVVEGIQGEVTAAGNVVSLFNGILAPRQTGKITVSVTATKPGIKTNLLNNLTARESGPAKSATALLTVNAGDTENPVVARVELSKKKVKRLHDAMLQITWASSDNVGVAAHDIQFAEDGKNFQVPVVSGLAGQVQRFVWNIPAIVPKTKTGVVKVIARDQAGNSGSANSPVFIVK
ncbi:MAG: YncE family protein [Blastocatellia bacterium]|nr:YncE family protein [Blastocatellia bacterium]